MSKEINLNRRKTGISNRWQKKEAAKTFHCTSFCLHLLHHSSHKWGDEVRMEAGRHNDTSASPLKQIHFRKVCVNHLLNLNFYLSRSRQFETDILDRFSLIFQDMSDSPMIHLLITCLFSTWSISCLPHSQRLGHNRYWHTFVKIMMERMINEETLQPDNQTELPFRFTALFNLINR